MCNCSRSVSLGFTDEMFPQGVHMCYFYNDDEERRSIIPEFIASGLNTNERTGYFAQLLPAPDLLGSLKSMGVDVPGEEREGHFHLSSTESTYHPEGVFDPDKMIGNLHAFYSESLEKGFAGARVSGEMGWALQDVPGSDRLLEDEAKVNLALKKSPVTAICQYNTNLFDGKTIMEVLRVHPLVIASGQVVHNPFFSMPEDMEA
ncbi:MAG: MEDS domain-containing protein [Flavobacteriales bacterium]